MAGVIKGNTAFILLREGKNRGVSSVLPAIPTNGLSLSKRHRNLAQALRARHAAEQITIAIAATARRRCRRRTYVLQ